MDAVASHDESELRSQLEQARGRLDDLLGDLRAVDAELEGLSSERQQVRLLHQACGALEELGAIGAGALFWGDRADREGDDIVRSARSRIDVFEKQLREIEVRRQAVVEEIQLQDEATELLEEDLYEAERKEELRKLEWIVEREQIELPGRASVMPWARGGEDDARFRKALTASLLLSLVLGLLLPMIDLPLPESWEVAEVPDRFTRLIREQRPVPPPQTLEAPKPEPKEQDPEEPVVAEETTPTAAPEKTAKPSAESKGILAFREKFSGLADNKAADRLGSQARISTTGAASSGRPQRSMVSIQASGSSSGINLAALSRDVGGGGGQIEGVEVVRATSSIGGGTGQDRPLSGGPSMGRTDEEIQIVFDRHKAALYRLYNRELRKNPTLQGQMILRLRIEPDGSVSLCELQSSNMNAPQLSAQVVGRVKTFDFGAVDGIPAVTILYPIDFLPAT